MCSLFGCVLPHAASAGCYETVPRHRNPAPPLRATPAAERPIMRVVPAAHAENPVLGLNAGRATPRLRRG
ncbi:MAG: hypothetical protein DHS20C14_04470 [Phycisphaeraceae bacterium]|nr:MAG: hypothetical protein DHS20C14_04470 [Phycisphaeraceae bacterium]